MTLTNHFSIGHILAPKSLQPSLHGPRDGVTTHILDDSQNDEPTAPPKKETKMNDKENRTLAAITKNSPINRVDLEAATNLSGQPLSVALWALKKGGHIVALPNQHYGVPGTSMPIRPKPELVLKKSAAPAKKAATPIAKTFAARVFDLNSKDEPAPAPTDDCRAAVTHDGHVLVIQGDDVIFSLTKNQAFAVQALGGLINY